MCISLSSKRGLEIATFLKRSLFNIWFTVVTKGSAVRMSSSLLELSQNLRSKSKKANVNKFLFTETPAP